MLFSPGAHEEITDAPWDEQWVRAAVGEIVAGTEEAFAPDTLWPVHPRDADYAGIGVYETHGLWSGAAGVTWALQHLDGEGAVDLGRDYASTAACLHEDYLRQAGGETPTVPGLWFGEAGILLVGELLAPDAGRADRLLAAIRSNAANETNELVWGSPGTMLAARVMLERTGDERWADAWHESADRLWDEWRWSDEHACHLWTQDLYGSITTYLGPAHGLAGNVLALAELLPEPRSTELVARVTQTVEALAFREDGLANWSPQAGSNLVGADGSIRTQWCHGAPGLVASLAKLEGGRELDELLLAGAELTWAAGPLAKGPGLCHGTAGNGFALLALYGRTGETVWLERARAFAMHALEQVAQERAAHGGGRFSLWTGDLGAALFAWQCIAGDPELPTIDAW